ncbi:MAG TPA: porin [Stellaceae bacterium]|nr:porin [Stellaceae bacterium]
MIAASTFPHLADAASLDMGPVKLDAGGTAMLGGSVFAGDDTNPGQAAYGRDQAGFEAYLLGRVSVEAQLDADTSLGVFVRARIYRSPGERSDVLPDADEVVKDAYLRLRTGTAGEFRLGWQADVRQNEAFFAPQVCDCFDGFYGTNSPEVTPMHGPVPANSTGADLDERTPKLAWYSPSWNGFRMAASYGPGDTHGRRIDGKLDLLGQSYLLPDGGVTTDPRDDRLRDAWSTIAVWSGSADEISLGFEAGASGAQRTGPLVVTGESDQGPFVWGGGFSLGYAAWKFGAAFEQQNFIDLEGVYGAAAYRLAPGGATLFQLPATNGIVNRTFDIGVTWSIGPVTTGIAWSRGVYEGLADPADIKHAAANDIVFTGAQYKFEEWGSVLAGLQWNHYDPGGSGHPLPAAAGLNAVYGGIDPTLNIWDKGYDGVALILGVAARF